MALPESRDKIVLLHFFAAFGKTSAKQLPQIQKLHEKYEKNGLVVLGITPENDRDRLREFARQNKLSYPILLKGGKVFKDYKLGQIPDVCIINKELVVSSMYIGFNPGNEEKIEAEVRSLLATVSKKD